MITRDGVCYSVIEDIKDMLKRRCGFSQEKLDKSLNRFIQEFIPSVSIDEAYQDTDPVEL